MFLSHKNKIIKISLSQIQNHKPFLQNLRVYLLTQQIKALKELDWIKII